MSISEEHAALLRMYLKLQAHVLALEQLIINLSPQHSVADLQSEVERLKGKFLEKLRLDAGHLLPASIDQVLPPPPDEEIP